MPASSRLLALLLMLALTAALLVARSEAAGEDDPEGAARRQDALDSILLCEDSDERTPIRFPHRLHYGPREEGGQAIDCGSCHHDYEGADAAPPRACRTCHARHDVAVEKAIESL